MDCITSVVMVRHHYTVTEWIKEGLYSYSSG